ncbi:follicle-stimulating hormone receptor-like, partial [Actinia tenebrosa]|uniref:Follicle-stimulating hormone receptor-like n=1 Tax=Actinia tenebrosa TaxID=6105 RepID=A0A6P8HXQ3_ACTTE
MNPLRSFTGKLPGLFPSLSTLDATGIEHWKPEKNFLHLRMLRSIIGLTWSDECVNCLLFKSYKTQMKSFVTLGYCHGVKRGVNVTSPLFQLLNETQFQFRCKNQNLCERHNYFASVNLVNLCWDAILVAMNCQSFLGGLSVVLNFVTFLNIITSRRLRKNVCMLLVCNIAFSDFLTGIYTIAITVYLNNVSYIQSHSAGDLHCWKIGMFWMLGQASAVVTSFFLTLERYLAIVYSLQPEVRITRRLAAFLIIICWLLAVFLTVIALFYNLYTLTFLCIPIRPEFFNTNIFAFTLSIVSAALILYAISFGFYVHIYFTVKKAAQDAGIQRESKLAKRIALLVFSNVFF